MGASCPRSSKTSGRDTHQALVCLLLGAVRTPRVGGLCVFSQETRGWTQNLPPAHLLPPWPRPSWAHGVGPLNAREVTSWARVWPRAHSPLGVTVECVSHILRGP